MYTGPKFCLILLVHCVPENLSPYDMHIASHAGRKSYEPKMGKNWAVQAQKVFHLNFGKKFLNLFEKDIRGILSL